MLGDLWRWIGETFILRGARDLMRDTEYKKVIKKWGARRWNRPSIQCENTNVLGSNDNSEILMNSQIMRPLLLINRYGINSYKLYGSFLLLNQLASKQPIKFLNSLFGMLNIVTNIVWSKRKLGNSFQMDLLVVSPNSVCPRAFANDIQSTQNTLPTIHLHLLHPANSYLCFQFLLKHQFLTL